MYLDDEGLNNLLALDENSFGAKPVCQNITQFDDRLTWAGFVESKTLKLIEEQVKQAALRTVTKTLPSWLPLKYNIVVVTRTSALITKPGSKAVTRAYLCLIQEE